MAQPSATSVYRWLEALASVERERRTYRAIAEASSRLSNVVKAATCIAQADEAGQELAELRAAAIAEGLPAEAITVERVEAWGIANLDAARTASGSGTPRKTCRPPLPEPWLSRSPTASQ